jgi:hypothetical protein
LPHSSVSASPVTMHLPMIPTVERSVICFDKSPQC